MASLQALARHYRRIARRWPVDALRPVQLANALQQRADALASPTSPTSQPVASHPGPLTGSTITADIGDVIKPTKAGDIAGSATATTTAAATREDYEQVNALYSLLENRYASAYKASPEMLHPAFKPDYYDALAAELALAPTRSWLGQKWLSLSRLVRFS